MLLAGAGGGAFRVGRGAGGGAVREEAWQDDEGKAVSIRRRVPGIRPRSGIRKEWAPILEEKGSILKEAPGAAPVRSQLSLLF